MTVRALAPLFSATVPIGLAAAGLVVLAAAGCTSAGLSRAIYEALYAREELLRGPPPTQPPPRRPDYAEYERERQPLQDEPALGRAVLPADRRPR